MTKKLSLLISVALLSFTVGYFVFAWTEPSGPPPGGNVPAPINVGTTTQTKEGGLNIATQTGEVGIGTTEPLSKLDVRGDVTLRESSPTITFRDTDNYTGFIHMNSNWMYFLSSDGADKDSWTKHGSYWPMRINMADDTIEIGGNVWVKEGDLHVAGNIYGKICQKVSYSMLQTTASSHWEYCPSGYYVVGLLGSNHDLNNPPEDGTMICCPAF